MCLAATVRMAEIVADAVEGRAAVADVGAAGAVVGAAVVAGATADAAGREGEGTRNVFHEFTRI